MFRLTAFTPTRRFWSIGWVRYCHRGSSHDGCILGFSIAARKRALAVELRDRPRNESR